ncbi:uncharacterized protein [Sagmatias obliquidens]|uniref:uncharacterized protein n=1 Tax=Sagmatias obliquidens TaxID=3371155 RepID=UPI000F444A08|nr:uncharacterized protein LOC113619289 [Lagenorhynchus obliquidens]
MGVGSEKRPHSQSAQDPYNRGSTREPATPRSEWGPRQSPTLRVTRTPRGASRADPRGVAAGAVPPRCHPEAETMPGAQTRDGPVSPPLRPRPTVAQGGGRQLGSSCRREVATGLRQRAGALAPPAPLRPAPGGARRSGPAPQPMERELSAEGGACRNKGRQNL